MNSVLVIGAGSIGIRHIQCLKDLGIPNVYVCEPDEAKRKLVQNMFDIREVFSDLDMAFKNSYDGAIVCVPNHLHAVVTVPIIERGIAVLLEKPIDINIEAAEKINEAAKKYNVTCQIGYCLRFSSVMEQIHEIIKAGTLGKVLCADVTVGQYLPDWRPGVDYRKNYSAKRSQGGGVCLDISHELDYFRWLFGEPVEVQSHAAQIGSLGIEVEDIAEAIVITDKGTIGRIHLDYLSRAPRRKLSITAEKGNIELDFIKGKLEIFEAGDEFWKVRSYNQDRNVMFKKQLHHFMNCVMNKSKPLIDSEEAIKTLKFALRMRKN